MMDMEEINNLFAYYRRRIDAMTAITEMMQNGSPKQTETETAAKLKAEGDRIARMFIKDQRGE